MNIKIHPAFYLYILFIGLIDGIESSIGLLFTLVIHEAGHLFVGHLCGEAYEQMVITPLGGMITYKSGSASCKGVRGMAVAAAGPLGNLAAAYAAVHAPVLAALVPRDDAQRFVMMNLSMALINAVPVLPLDGGRMVFSAGYYLFPLSRLIAALTYLGRLWGGICIALSLYAAMQWGKLNITLLACGVYIILCAGQQRTTICAGNLHTVIQERLADCSEAAACQLICVKPSARLSSMIPYLGKSGRVLCILEEEDSHRFIGERFVLALLLTSPFLTFEQAFPGMKGKECDQDTDPVGKRKNCC